jgi:periplasmic copper chaperone A
MPTSPHSQARPAVRRRVALVAGLLLSVVAACSPGGDDPGDDGGSSLSVQDGWAAEATDVAAVYLRIDNPGEADRLVGASSDVTGAVTVMGEAGGGPGGHQGPEEPIDVAVEPGETEFSPGSGHVMLSDLPEPLVPGDTVALTLEFERNGERTLDVDIVDWGEAVERYEEAT